jgi:hypothetical protein
MNLNLVRPVIFTRVVYREEVSHDREAGVGESLVDLLRLNLHRFPRSRGLVQRLVKQRLT